MSFLLRKEQKPQMPTPSTQNIVLGVSVSFMVEGGDLIINAKARTKKDVQRLKIIITEMLDEILKHEEQPVGTTSPRGFRSKH